MVTALTVSAGALAAPAAATPGTPGAAGTAVAPAPPTAPPTGDIEITDLPADLVLWDINDRGQILGRESGTGGDIVVVEDGVVTDTVGPWGQFPSPLCPGPICFWPPTGRADINERGVVGTSIGGHATLWDDGEITDLNDDARGSWLLALNDRDQALVTRFMTDHQVVGLWDRGQLTTIGTWPLDHLVVGRLSERGDVVLGILGIRPPTPTITALHWRRGVTTALEGLAPSDINDRGQIIGQKFDPASPTGGPPVLWEDGELTALPSLDGGSTASPSFINDRGQIVGSSTVPGVMGSTVVLWDDGEIVDIGAAVDGRQLRALGLSDRGQVLITGFSADFNAIGAVWQRGQVRLLPPSGEPGADAEPSLLNDRGQVVGKRFLPGSDRYTTTLWEL